MKLGIALANCFLAIFAIVGVGSTCFLPTARAQVFTEPSRTSPPAKPKVRRRPKPSAPAPASSNRQEAPPKGESRIATFRDPTAYCSANPTIDEPGPTYVGQPVPGWISGAWTGNPDSSVQERAFNWRCLNGRVLACSSASVQPECGKPNDERSPSSELVQFCAGKRKATVRPDVAVNSLPIWACKNSNPIIIGYRTGLDERGYFSTQWRDVTDYSPTNMMGAVPRNFIGTWYVQMNRSRFSSTGIVVNGRQATAPSVDSAVFRIFGGVVGDRIGTIEYFTRYMENSPVMFCRVDVILIAAASERMEIEERLRQRDVGDRCSSTMERLTFQPSDGKMKVEWRRVGDPKPRKSAWGARDPE